MVVRRLVAPLVVMVALLLAALAPAGDRPTATLVYTRGAGAGSCPDETAIKQSVAVRLGYDPFVASDAKKTIVVAIVKQGAELKAQIDVRNPEGKTEGTRKLSSSGDDCTELASSITLAISIAIDPLNLGAPSSSVSSSASTSSSPSASTTAHRVPPYVPPSATTDVPQVPRDSEWVASLGAVAAMGAAPSLTFGGTASIARRWPWWSIGAELRADLPASNEGLNGGEVQSNLILGTAFACLFRQVLFGCPMVSVGAIHGTGARAEIVKSESRLYLAAGLRLGIEAPIGEWFAFRVFGEMLGTFTRVELRINNERAWITPILNGSLGAATLWRF